jgi:hypothetical protein
MDNMTHMSVSAHATKHVIAYFPLDPISTWMSPRWRDAIVAAGGWSKIWMTVHFSGKGIFFWSHKLITLTNLLGVHPWHFPRPPIMVSALLEIRCLTFIKSSRFLRHLICLVIHTDMRSASGLQPVFLSCARLATHIFLVVHGLQLIFF